MKVKKKILKDLIKEKEGFIIQNVDENINKRENLELKNGKKLTIAFIIIFILMIININFISAPSFTSFITDFYIDNQNFYLLISLMILVTILYNHLNYYNIKINTQEINIRNNKIIAGFSSSINCNSISKKNLLSYSFTNHSLSFNKTLVLKIKSDEGEVLSKSFIVSFLSSKEELRIKKYLVKLLKKKLTLV